MLFCQVICWPVFDHLPFVLSTLLFKPWFLYHPGTDSPSLALPNKSSTVLCFVLTITSIRHSFIPPPPHRVTPANMDIKNCMNPPDDEDDGMAGRKQNSTSAAHGTPAPAQRTSSENPDASSHAATHWAEAASNPYSRASPVPAPAPAPVPAPPARSVAPEIRAGLEAATASYSEPSRSQTERPWVATEAPEITVPPSRHHRINNSSPQTAPTFTTTNPITPQLPQPAPPRGQARGPAGCMPAISRTLTTPA